MSRTILITGATAGIGLETAKKLGRLGHRLLLHGRSQAKVDQAAQEVNSDAVDAVAATYIADLSDLGQVEQLAQGVLGDQTSLDVLINNAGVFKVADPIAPDGLDVRFVVNSVAPYLLTKRLLPLMPPTGRIVNLSSAAQAPVDVDALAGRRQLDDMSAYAQSKLSITMWTRHLADELGDGGPAVIAVNPGSLLATRMVKEGFGVAGNDINIGADIVVRASLDDEFADKSGAYFDNDAGRFAPPQADGLDDAKADAVVAAHHAILAQAGLGSV